eukprot:TRINITY_DN10087_c0_g1_i1.p1 TRINITY_DN10087_c0_g1~~TRINITY_DN10087_c0_g1_i1.p1  ORF type:complete len:311 (+),score=80.96 TRINITY_DN10087_c0_g1_i1:1-933(+)
MDGISAVKEIMKIKPTPILMVSSLTSEDAEITFEALELGAIDFILKPGTLTLKMEESEKEFLSKIETLSNIPKNRVKIRKEATAKRIDLSKKLINTIKTNEFVNNVKADGLVMIGSSTGGPGLIEMICTSLPQDYPFPIVVIQHMPETFTAGFAKRINEKSKLNVVESDIGSSVVAGKVIIAKGGVHTTLGKKASGVMFIKHKEKNSRFFTPSVDELFLSAAKTYDPTSTLAIELTGVGNDGAEGMLVLREKGAYTIAEDETTAIVYGMTKSCWDNGAAQKKLPFPKIVKEILDFPTLLKEKNCEEAKGA